MGRKKGGILNIFRLPGVPDLGLEPDTKKSIFIIFIMALGVISLLGLFGAAGIFGEYLRYWLVLGFGWVKFIFPIALIIWGFFLYMEERFEVRGGNYLGGFLFILSISALMFLVIEPDKWSLALARGDGGGYVGLVLADSLYKFTGMAVSWLIILGLLVTSILLLFKASLKHLIGREGLMGKIFWPLAIIFKLFRRGSADENGGPDEAEKEDEENEEEDDDDDEEETNETEKLGNQDTDESDGEEEDEEEINGDNEANKTESLPAFSKSKIKEDEPDIWWKKKNNIKINLPLDILSGQIGKPKSGDIEANKEIIKRTMENFGIPVEMGEANVGPTVTQYTLKPAEGIKLSKITILGNDLALALALHPIRIEAPIPNKSLVGIEVPNKAKAIVGLKEILTSDGYKYRKNNFYMALGKDVSGKAWLDDLGKMPHLLVAGATNSGKSVCLNAIVVSLMYQNNPDDLRFIMVDPKRVELSIYNGIPYLMCPVITNIKDTINALKWCLNEMDRRLEILSVSHKRNVADYNEGAKIKMPYIVFIIDELADLMVANGRDIEGGVIRLAQMARAIGIHLILATQRPSVDVITGIIKANMPARAAFAVASGVDSRTIIDSLGADKLLGRGDMLFKNAEMPKAVRLQGAFVSDSEIKKIIRYVKEKSGGPQYLKEVIENRKVKGMGGVGLDIGNDEQDELFEEAKEMIINTNKASTTFLQRKFGIGYARAAKILDALEEAGVVGPSNGSKPREIMISREQYEAVADIGVSGVSLHKREEAEAPEEFLTDEDEDDEEDKEENETEGSEEETDETDENKKPGNQETDEDDAEEENEEDVDTDDSEEIFEIKKDDSEIPPRKPNEKKPIDNFEDKLFSR